jgi:probable F420-dependent oxidoreductase
MMYPVPYAGAAEAVELAVQAERLGFESVWGNDHVSTQQYVRREFADPPRFWDPFVYLSFVAARTTHLRLATAVTVMAFRHPASVAKQAATLDHLSGGRMVLGVGIGAYREEFESLYPGAHLHRGDHADEYLAALRILFDQRRGSFDGQYVSFSDLESNPKPLQNPLPILSGGNSPGSRRRAATVGGWLPACLTPGEYADGIREITHLAGGKLPTAFEPALQVVVAIGPTHEEAVERFVSSQVHTHLTSLGNSTMKGRLGDDLATRNLIGTDDEICEQVAAYSTAGVGTLAGLLFAADSVPETLEQMDAFSSGVIARLA